MFDELDQYLTADYNINHWSDLAIDHATELLDAMNDVDWQKLLKTWPHRPTHWQRQLAEEVYASEKPRVLDLLVALLYSP